MASSEDYPRTLSELGRRFSIEEACREYRVALRWPEGFVCPRCGHGHAWLLARGLFQCAATQAREDYYQQVGLSWALNSAYLKFYGF